MIRLHRHPVVLSLLCGIALLAANCGGGDDDPGHTPGARGGKAGAGTGGKGGAGGRGGSSGASGESGSNGEGGTGASPSSGGTGGTGGTGGSTGGTDATGGTNSSGGAAGDAGAPNGAIELTEADSATKLIEADAGGTVTLGALTLVIPPDALAEDTEITIRSFEELSSFFVLEPSGLEFEAPITARFTVPAAALDPQATEMLPVFVLETGSLGEPMELVDSTSVVFDDADNFVGEGQLTHFSGLMPRAAVLPIQGSSFVRVDDLTVKPVVVPVDVQFATLARVALSDDEPFDLVASREDNGDPISVHLVPAGATADRTNAVVGARLVRIPDVPDLPVPDGPVALGLTQGTMVSRQFRCTEPGSGYAFMGVHLVVSFEATSSGYGVFQDEYGQFDLVPGVRDSRTITVSTIVGGTSTTVECLDQPGTLVPYELDYYYVADLYEPAWQEDCTWLSDHSSCQAPDPARAITNVLHVELEVGPDAAARLDAAFPCGEGPIGTTFCGTPGTISAGEYELVVATFGDDIPLDDEYSYFQHAVVFDADGLASNNYEPPPQYVDDFFGGSDLWFQLFYSPDTGFSMKVVDARISTSNPVASNARMVIAGRELSVLIPRAELDGTAPGCRASTFRHEGDYGLDGGPWDASYHPPLGEPLLPAANDDVLVLPE